jgi:hypothetical protein
MLRAAWPALFCIEIENIFSTKQDKSKTYSIFTSLFIRERIQHKAEGIIGARFAPVGKN